MATRKTPANSCRPAAPASPPTVHRHARSLRSSRDGVRCHFSCRPGRESAGRHGDRDYDGIAWTGCSSCVFSGEPDVALQIEFARECFRQGVPAFGSCWAAQIAVVAAGGQVALNPKGREMGIARAIREPRGPGGIRCTRANRGCSMPSPATTTRSPCCPTGGQTRW
ncbi:MAG: hypothetical protein CM1200mP29_16110 [Verrucomicrobiota bacterium]|nr:MAG: hypothetical protein CM1200mP29_16110 [Verrucomicrobiota bacterium]